MPSRSPVPFLIARSMVSFGMFTERALSAAARSRGLALMSPPPSRADTVSSLMILVHTLDFLESVASFLCLILDQRLWPDMPANNYHKPAPGVGGIGVRFQACASSHAAGSSRCTACPDQPDDDTATQPP